jgi:hypothetical protein
MTVQVRMDGVSTYTHLALHLGRQRPRRIPSPCTVSSGWAHRYDRMMVAGCVPGPLCSGRPPRPAPRPEWPSGAAVPQERRNASSEGQDEEERARQPPASPASACWRAWTWTRHCCLCTAAAHRGWQHRDLDSYEHERRWQARRVLSTEGGRLRRRPPGRPSSSHSTRRSHTSSLSAADI